VAYVQPPRDKADGPLGAERFPKTMGTFGGVGRIQLHVETCGEDESIVCSEHNAARLLVALAMVLGVRINAADLKGIKL